jgi:hypothetical protein
MLRLFPTSGFIFVAFFAPGAEQRRDVGVMSGNRTAQPLRSSKGLPEHHG